MSYTKKQFAEKMIDEIICMHNKGFVYQSIGALSHLNNFTRTQLGKTLFPNLQVNHFLEQFNLTFAPMGFIWLNEDKKAHMKIKKKRLNICPAILLVEAQKTISKIKTKDSKVYLKVDKEKKKSKK